MIMCAKNSKISLNLLKLFWEKCRLFSGHGVELVAKVQAPFACMGYTPFTRSSLLDDLAIC